MFAEESKEKIRKFIINYYKDHPEAKIIMSKKSKGKHHSIATEMKPGQRLPGGGNINRKFSGERNARAKLTQKIANEIREEYKNNKISLNKLAKKYNVSKKVILNIIQYKSYID